MPDGKITDQTDGVQIASGDQVLVDRAGADRRVPLATTGTFTPGLAFGGASVGMTFVARSGRYTRIANRIFFNLTIELSAKGSSAGSATITGLPVASEATANNIQCFSIRVNAMISTVGGMQARVVPGATTIDLSQTGTGTPANLNQSQFSDASIINISGQYEV